MKKSEKTRALEKLVKKLKRWEPRRKVVRNEVSIDEKVIYIFAWAAGHFEGYKEVDLYIDDRGRLLGVKPVAKGQRTLISKAKGRGFSVACTPLMNQIGVNERKRVPAEWSERGKMLVVYLKGRKPVR